MYFPDIKATHSNKIPQKQKELFRQSNAVAMRRLRRFLWVTSVPAKHPGGKPHQRQTSLGQQQCLFCDLHWKAHLPLDHKTWFAFFVGLPLGRTWIQMFHVLLERDKSLPSLSPARRKQQLEFPATDKHMQSIPPKPTPLPMTHSFVIFRCVRTTVGQNQSQIFQPGFHPGVFTELAFKGALCPFSWLCSSFTISIYKCLICR